MGRAGGSYGGAGGVHSDGSQGQPAYGSSLLPLDLGSGGAGQVGTWSGAGGGAGGGAIRLVVSGTTTLNGEISANGLGGASYYGGEPAGGGAGGSIWLNTGALTGSGVFSANGGAPVYAAGGGGGGRIAVFYNDGSAFTGYTNTTVAGGGGSAPGQNGTVIFGNTMRGPALVDYLIPAFGFAFQSPSVNAGSLQVGIEGGPVATFNMAPESVMHLAKNLVLEQGAVMYQGGGSWLDVAGTISVLDSNTVLVAQAENTSSQLNGVWAGTGVTITASNLYVAAGAAISTDAQGYVGGCGGPACGPGGASGDWCGGGYGGAGGGPRGGAAYGSISMPSDLGSGGHGNCGTWSCAGGGGGGGAIRLIVTGTTTVNGQITANGGDGASYWGGEPAGGGAGGSFWLDTSVLTGTGLLTANGGTAVYCAGGGGGGRMAIYQAQMPGFDVSQCQVQPSQTGGAVGTLFISDLVPLQVLSQSPSGVAVSTVDYVDVTFNSAVASNTLSIGDLVFSTPAGVIPSSQLAVTQLGAAVFRITCPLQWAQGTYTLQVGPALSSAFGLAMTNAYTGTFTIQWPSITGTIRTPQAWPVGGVTLLTNGTAAMTTGTNGLYAVVVPPNWTGTISPLLGAATFAPASSAYTNVTDNVLGADITMQSGYVPALSLFPLSGSGLRYEWPTLLGLFYQLQSSADLANWNDCGDIQTGTGGTLRLDLDTSSASYMFYRLLVSGP
jgi:hypothetical protein